MSRKQDTQQKLRRLSLPALPVSYINKSERNQHFRTIRSKVIFLAPLNMILIHRKQLSGCHTASSPISSPLILPIHTLSPHLTPNLRPLLKQKTVAKLASVCPSCLIKMLLTKKHRFLLLSLSLIHFSSFSSALVSSLLPTSPKESTTTTTTIIIPTIIIIITSVGERVEDKRHKRPTY